MYLEQAQDRPGCIAPCCVVGCVAGVGVVLRVEHRLGGAESVLTGAWRPKIDATFSHVERTFCCCEKRLRNAFS
jgi:hypothetical protein